MNQIIKADIKNFVELFLSTKNESTIKKYRSTINRVNGELTYMNILIYLNGIAGNNYYNNQLSVFKSLFRFLEDQRIIEINPLKAIKYRKDDSTSYAPLSSETVNKIESIYDQMTPYILLGINTGLRSSNLVQAHNFDLIKGHIIIKTKGKVVQKVKLNSLALKCLKQIKLNPLNIKVRQFRSRIASYCKTYELDKFSCHQLRATFATSLYQQQMPIEKIGKLLGHSSTITTERYVRTLLSTEQIELPNKIGGVV